MNWVVNEIHFVTAVLSHAKGGINYIQVLMDGL